MSKFAAKYAFLFAIFLFVFSLATRNVSAATVVTPSNMNGWAFEVVGDGVGSFVSGPDTVPSGNGSVRLFTGTTGNNRTAIFRTDLGSLNTPLSNVTNLDYSTYSQSVSDANKFPVMLINVQTDYGMDVIRFDPEEQIQAEVSNSWQTWDADAGVWTSSIFPGFLGGTISDYVTYVSTFSSAPVIVNRPDTTGGFRVEIGPGSTPEVFDGSVDSLTIGLMGSDTTYDFEPSVVTPTNNYEQQFYLNNDWTNPLSSGPTTINNTNTLGFNWGSGSPAGVPADNFSAEWTGTFNFENALYRFTAATDKQLEVYVDGIRIVNQTAYGTTQAIYQGTAGVKTVTVKYSHGTGNAFVRYNFWKTTECFDMNADNNINSMDLSIVARNFVPTGAALLPQNINGDNAINALDLQQVAMKFGKTCGVNFL